MNNRVTFVILLIASLVIGATLGTLLGRATRPERATATVRP